MNSGVAIPRSSEWRTNSASHPGHCNASYTSSALRITSFSIKCGANSQCDTCANRRWQSARLLTCSGSQKRALSTEPSNAGPASHPKTSGNTDNADKFTDQSGSNPCHLWLGYFEQPHCILGSSFIKRSRLDLASNQK